MATIFSRSLFNECLSLSGKFIASNRVSIAGVAPRPPHDYAAADIQQFGDWPS
jgi:hypothetical protein